MLFPKCSQLPLKPFRLPEELPVGFSYSGSYDGLPETCNGLISPLREYVEDVLALKDHDLDVQIDCHPINVGEFKSNCIWQLPDGARSGVKQIVIHYGPGGILSNHDDLSLPILDQDVLAMKLEGLLGLFSELQDGDAYIMEEQTPMRFLPALESGVSVFISIKGKFF